MGPEVESEKEKDDEVHFHLRFLQPSLRTSDLIPSHGHPSNTDFQETAGICVHDFSPASVFSQHLLVGMLDVLLWFASQFR